MVRGVLDHKGSCMILLIGRSCTLQLERYGINSICKFVSFYQLQIIGSSSSSHSNVNIVTQLVLISLNYQGITI